MSAEGLKNVVIIKLNFDRVRGDKFRLEKCKQLKDL